MSSVLHAQAVADERVARARHRSLAKAQRASRRGRERAWRERLAAAIKATRTKQCHCRLHATMTAHDLVALGAGCTAPLFICPRLAKVRRRVGL